MYTAVLMLAMTSGGESIDFGRRSCSGCYGCSGYVACSGCYSSCHARNYSCSGCYSGCHVRYYSGCSGCSGYYRSGYYNYSYAPRYYGSEVYYPPNVVVQGPYTEVRQSFYRDPSDSSARVRVLLPNSDAEVWFNDVTTAQRGMERMFSSPPLEPGSRYMYTVKARWNEEGRTVDRERRVEIQPGQPMTVDFRINPGEKLAVPKTSKER